MLENKVGEIFFDGNLDPYCRKLKSVSISHKSNYTKHNRGTVNKGIGVGEVSVVLEL